QPGFTDLLSPGIMYGTVTTTLSGHLSAGSTVPPVGETVSITVNGLTQRATLNGSGDFSLAFPTGTLGVMGSPYTVSYSLAGAGNSNSVSDSSTTLIVRPALLTAVVTVNDKFYDGTTTAAVASKSLSGTIYGVDVVSVTGGMATFSTASAGTNKPVTVTG